MSYCANNKNVSIFGADISVGLKTTETFAKSNFLIDTFICKSESKKIIHVMSKPNQISIHPFITNLVVFDSIIKNSNIIICIVQENLTHEQFNKYMAIIKYCANYNDKKFIFVSSMGEKINNKQSNHLQAIIEKEITKKLENHVIISHPLLFDTSPDFIKNITKKMFLIAVDNYLISPVFIDDVVDLIYNISLNETLYRKQKRIILNGDKSMFHYDFLKNICEHTNNKRKKIFIIKKSSTFIMQLFKNIIKPILPTTNDDLAAKNEFQIGGASMLFDYAKQNFK